MSFGCLGAPSGIYSRNTRVVSKLQSGEAFRKIPRRLAYVVFMCTSGKDTYNACFLELLVHVKSAFWRNPEFPRRALTSNRCDISAWCTLGSEAVSAHAGLW